MTTVSNVKMQFIKQKNYNNLKEWCEDPNNIYIGRKGIVFINKERYPKNDSIWANPFKIKNNNREDVLQLYKEYITKKISENPDIYNLNTLKNKNLGCWCVDEINHNIVCHGQILLELINKI